MKSLSIDDLQKAKNGMRSSIKNISAQGLSVITMNGSAHAQVIGQKGPTLLFVGANHG